MRSRYFFSIYVTLIFILLAVSLISLFFGSAKLTVSDIIGAVLGRDGYSFERIILLSLRLPRLAASILAGAGLSIAGVILQSVMGNDLASPNTIGVSSGAGFASVICLSFFPVAVHLLPFAAFIGAFAAALIVAGISRAAGGGKTSVILSGIALTSVFSACISTISAFDTDVLVSYSAFSVGGFQGVSLERLIVPTVLIVSCFVVSICLSGRISALSLGDEAAAGLGIAPRMLRTLCLLIVGMSSAAVVSFAGLLGFVGLIVPHMASKLVGADFRRQIIAAPLIGGIIVTLSDLAGRVLFAPSEISAGIIMAFVGAPFFFFLILRRGNRHA